MTVVGCYYLVVSLIVIVVGAAVIARIIKVSPRAWRVIANFGGALGVVLVVLWLAQLYLRTNK